MKVFLNVFLGLGLTLGVMGCGPMFPEGYYVAPRDGNIPLCKDKKVLAEGDGGICLDGGYYWFQGNLEDWTIIHE